VFNIGADQPCTLNELARAVSRVMGTDTGTLHLPARQEVLHAHSAHDKIRRILGVRTGTTLEAGLQRMATWVKAHGPRASRPFEGIEVTRNLPAAWREA
jgi:UDP-glucose 4-epimerase